MEAIAAARLVLAEFERWGLLTDDVLLARLRLIEPQYSATFWRRIRVRLTREGTLKRHHLYPTRHARAAGYQIATEEQPHGRLAGPRRSQRVFRW